MIMKPQGMIFIAAMMAVQVAYGEAVDAVSEKRFIMAIEGHKLSVPYYSNNDIQQKSEKINRIVIVTHGAGRNGISETRLTEAAIKLGVNDKTIIVLPQFLIEEDIEKHGIQNDVLFWDGGWREGDASISTKNYPRPASISSYEVMNRLVEQLLANNPKVKNVIFTGHSAGGQITQRFAAGSQLEDDLRKKKIKVRYVLSNPSTYVYLDENRRVGNALDLFATPSEETIKSCANYNQYKLGLDDLNEMMLATGADKIRENYAKRDIVYLLSADDNDPAHYQLEKSCGALLQGVHRLERGTIHYHYAKKYFNDSKYGKKTLAVVPDFAHTSSILASECGSLFIFDKGKCDYIE